MGLKPSPGYKPPTLTLGDLRLDLTWFLKAFFCVQDNTEFLFFFFSHRVLSKIKLNLCTIHFRGVVLFTDSQTLAAIYGGRYITPNSVGCDM